MAQFLDNCPIIASEGRLFPIEINHVEHASAEPIHIQAAMAVKEILSNSNGDVLVFLPGVGEIRRTASELENVAADEQIALMQLYGDMPLEEQQAVLAPAERRKIVLATNVAETSITIEGITAVIDTGWARVLRNDPKLGMNRLELERISQAAAAQRAGRAGAHGAGSLPAAMDEIAASASAGVRRSRNPPRRFGRPGAGASRLGRSGPAGRAVV